MIYPLFGIGVQGKSSNVIAQERVNLYLDQLDQADKTQVAAYPTPGCKLYHDFGLNTTRGMWYFQTIDVLIAVQARTVYKILPGGTSVVIGILASDDSTGNVSMSDNGTQLIIVTGQYGYIWDSGTSILSQIGSPFPGANTVTFLDGYFLINEPNSGRFWSSAAYDGLTWNALNFATAEGSPDNVIAVQAHLGICIVFGAFSTEIWTDVGSIGFPFAKIMGAQIDYGLAARWSLAKCGGIPTGLFRNRAGQYFFAQLQNYSVQAISPPDQTFLINQYQNPEDCIAFAYSKHGHPFYQATFPTEGKSWLYDAKSNIWSKLESAGIRHIADKGAAFNTKFIVSDWRDGKLYEYDEQTYTDNGAMIPRELVGRHMYSSQNLNWLRMRRLRVDLESGVGVTQGQGENPTIMLQISRDGGHTWGRELWTTWGRLGEYTERAEWRQLGVARDWLFKIRVTDPVKTVFINAFVEGLESQS